MNRQRSEYRLNVFLTVDVSVVGSVIVIIIIIIIIALKMCNVHKVAYCVFGIVLALMI